MKRLIIILLLLTLSLNLFALDSSLDFYAYYDKATASTAYTLNVTLSQNPSSLASGGRPSVNVADFLNTETQLFTWTLTGGSTNGVKLKFISSALTSEENNLIPYTLGVKVNNPTCKYSNWYTYTLKYNTSGKYFLSTKISNYYYKDVLSFSNGTIETVNSLPYISKSYSSNLSETLELGFKFYYYKNNNSNNPTSYDESISRSGTGYITVAEPANLPGGHYSTIITVVLEAL